MMKAYHSYLALMGLDDNCQDYIKFVETLPSADSTVTAKPGKEADSDEGELQRAIIKGLSDEAARLTEALVKETDGLDIVNGQIIPALNKVGEGFEKKTVYLPQLLMSAEAAKAAFEQVRLSMQGKQEGKNSIPFVLATVKGDIHDIGKNIVKLLLQNYGFDVIDLGKDVPPEVICAPLKSA
jgi:5-methyltetrahydrofolate--homocysteine methyltransferase